MALVVAIYGLALFANSVAVSLLGSAMPTSLSIFLNACGRAIGAASICAFLWWKRWREDGNKAASTGPSAPATPARASVSLIPRFLIILCIPVLSYTGYVFYIELSREKGNVSVLSPLVGLYGIVPVGVGLLFRGESKTMRKLVGILLSCVAIVVLGMSAKPSSSSDAASAADGDANSAGAWLFRGLLFLGTFLSWGVSDLLSASVRTDPLTSILLNCCGQFICATVSGFAVFATYTQRLNDLQMAALRAYSAVDSAAGGGGGAVDLVPLLPDRVSVASPVVLIGWPHVFLLAINALSVVAWLAYCRLGQLAPMSVFIPIVNSYACLPVALAVVFMGEEITLLKAAGIALALGAIWLIGGGKEPAKATATSTTATTTDSPTDQAAHAKDEGQSKPADIDPTTSTTLAFSGALKRNSGLEDDDRKTMLHETTAGTNEWAVDSASKQYLFSPAPLPPAPGNTGLAPRGDAAFAIAVDGGTGGSSLEASSWRDSATPSPTPGGLSLAALPPPVTTTVVNSVGDAGTGLSASENLRRHPFSAHQQQASFAAISFPPALSPNARA